MKKTKKIIALALAMIMCLGILPLSASAATVGEKHTVTFDTGTFPVPADVWRPADKPITVTNGDLWDLVGFYDLWPDWETGWYTIDLEPIVNGTVIDLDSDITLYACQKAYAEVERVNLAINKDADKIAATASSWAQADVLEAIKLGLVPKNRLAFEAGNLQLVISRINFCELIAGLIEAKTGMDATAYAESLGKTVGRHFIDSTGYPAIEAAYALGIVNGVSENKFDGGKSIKRQEAAVMLERAAKVLGISSSGSGMTFTDDVAD